MTLTLFAQNKKAGSSISGTVVDKQSGVLLEFVTIHLRSKANNDIIKTVLTNKKGKFTIDSVPAGEYLLRADFIGLIAPDKEIKLLSGQANIELMVIQMEQDSHVLKEVNVTAKKSNLVASIDRKIYNVGQDILAQSGSVSDILKNVPSIEVDIEGNVSLRGSEEVLILINSRPSPLMGKNRASVLQQIPANTIERIEVITNPSARFRPDGTSGIINIVLKKNTKGGFNGNITANAGNQARSNSSVNFNYKQDKLNSFLTYSIRQDERNRYGTTDRHFFDAANKPAGSYFESNSSKARPLSHFFRGGLDFEMNAANSFGFSASFLPSALVRNSIQSRQFFDNAAGLTSESNRIRHSPATEMEKDATVYWEHNFKKEGNTIRFELTTSSQSEDEKNYYTNNYFKPLGYKMLDNNWVNQIEKNQQLTIDYTNALTEDSKLELGYAGSFIQQDIDFYVENYDTVTRQFNKNMLTSNRFLFNQSLHAFYGTYQKTIQNFSFSLGLRAEQAYTSINLITADSLIKNSYFQLYPTLHLAYKLPKGELQLNYSRRANRPEGDDMNPFPEIMDPLNLFAGNPQLLPEYIHSVEFGYQWKNKIFTIVPSVYYRYKYNGFTTITRPLKDSILLTTRENLSNDQSAGLELVVSAKPTNLFSANLSTNIFYNTINTDFTGIMGSKSIFSMSANFNTSYTITPSTMVQLSCNYRSARQTAQGIFYPSFVMNMGVKKDLFKNKVSIIATISDIFKTLEQKAVLNTSFLQQTSINTRDRQVFYLGFNYRFGKIAKKQVEEKMQYDNAF